MLGFIFGTLCLIGLFKVLGHGRRHRRHHRGHAHWRGRRGLDMRGGFAAAAGEVFKRRLDIDEDQEGIVDHAFVDLKDAVKELKEVFSGSRTDIADAFRADKVDEGKLAVVFAHHDEELARSRRNIVSALKQVHAVLEPDQRDRAADWLGTTEGRWA